LKEILAEGQEGNVKFRVIWNYGNSVYLAVENIETNQALNHIYECMYRPIFGIDVADYAELDKKLDELS
jgi:hypothetical protein